LEKISLASGHLNLDFIVQNDGKVSLVNFSTENHVNSLLQVNPNEQNSAYNVMQPIEVKVTGINSPAETHGPKYSLSAPSYRLMYVKHTLVTNDAGQLLTLVQQDKPTGLQTKTYYQTYTDLDIVRVWSELENVGSQTLGIEYVSSFSYIGIDQAGALPAADKLNVWLPHNAWQKELNWQQYSLAELGMSNVQGDKRRSSNLIQVANTGNWSTKHFLPEAVLENKETDQVYFWQIEQNGSWCWEIGDQDGQLYLKASGPTEQESGWWHALAPGGKFSTVKVAAGQTIGDYQAALQTLVQYRRRIRRPNKDDEQLPVIFNDYMNSLFGDPTTAKEIPMIEKAAEAGCEYYCIDCGWYDKGYWWDTVGEWQESKERFPNGLKELTNLIKEKGMVPGLWLELEVMGINGERYRQSPQNWFFQRHGQTVFDRSRAQLDFRNPEVRAYCTDVVDRLIRDYGIGYIKMDYNIDVGIGTDYKADSSGQGLLEHNRAYLKWLDRIFARYPDLVIENCSSGGLRMDYAMLSRYSIQSTSDQEDYRHYATIASNAASGVNSEQAAIWSYPMVDATDEAVIFNMTNALLHRIHQSGHLANLSSKHFNLVKKGISAYKEIRPHIKNSLPVWPLGLATYEDQWLAYGEMDEENQVLYLAVWRRESADAQQVLPLEMLRGKPIKVTQVYPDQAEYSSTVHWNEASGLLTVTLPETVCARVYRVEY
jgi:alpha-galactosidase